MSTVYVQGLYRGIESGPSGSANSRVMICTNGYKAVSVEISEQAFQELAELFSEPMAVPASDPAPPPRPPDPYSPPPSPAAPPAPVPEEPSYDEPPPLFKASDPEEIEHEPDTPGETHSTPRGSVRSI